jgi:hypothetical protein
MASKLWWHPIQWSPDDVGVRITIHERMYYGIELSSLAGRSALFHQKSYPAARSTGGQDILVALSAGELGTGDRPPITSSCQCSSKVPEAGGLVSSADGGVFRNTSSLIKLLQHRRRTYMSHATFPDSAESGPAHCPGSGKHGLKSNEFAHVPLRARHHPCWHQSHLSTSLHTTSGR